MKKQYKNINKAIAKMASYDRHNGYYVEVFYDKEADTIYSHAQCSLGFNSWTVYHDRSVIKVGNFVKKVTRKRLIEAIEKAISLEAELSLC